MEHVRFELTLHCLESVDIQQVLIFSTNSQSCSSLFSSFPAPVCHEARTWVNIPHFAKTGDFWWPDLSCHCFLISKVALLYFSSVQEHAEHKGISTGGSHIFLHQLGQICQQSWFHITGTSQELQTHQKGCLGILL